MSPEIQKICKKYITLRFTGRSDRYIEEWQYRFEEGIEWQKSDYMGRKLLQELAPNIYPKDKDGYFKRETK